MDEVAVLIINELADELINVRVALASARAELVLAKRALAEKEEGDGGSVVDDI